MNRAGHSISYPAIRIATRPATSSRRRPSRNSSRMRNCFLHLPPASHPAAHRQPGKTRVSAFENHLGEGEVSAVGDRERNVIDAETVREFPCNAVEMKDGLASRDVGHLNVAPADAASPAGTQGLHRRFFRGKASRVALHFVSV